METTVTLTPLEPDDLTLLYTIENNPEQWHIATAAAPYSRYDLQNYIATQQHDIYADRQLRLVIRTQGKAAGLIDLCNFCPQHNRAEIAIALLAQYRHQGIARIALQRLERYATCAICLHQLYAVVPSDNDGSRALFTAAGYRHNATLTHWLQRPKQYIDALIMQKILG